MSGAPLGALVEDRPDEIEARSCSEQRCVRTDRRAARPRQSRRRHQLFLLINQVENDRSGLEHCEITINQSRNATIWIDLQIVLRFLRILCTVNEYKVVLLVELFEHHVRCSVGVAWKVVKLVHRYSWFAFGRGL